MSKVDLVNLYGGQAYTSPKNEEQIINFLVGERYDEYFEILLRKGTRQKSDKMTYARSRSFYFLTSQFLKADSPILGVDTRADNLLRFLDFIICNFDTNKSFFNDFYDYLIGLYKSDVIYKKLRELLGIYANQRPEGTNYMLFVDFFNKLREQRVEEGLFTDFTSFQVWNTASGLNIFENYGSFLKSLPNLPKAALEPRNLLELIFSKGKEFYVNDFKWIEFYERLKVTPINIKREIIFELFRKSSMPKCSHLEAFLTCMAQSANLVPDFETLETCQLLTTDYFSLLEIFDDYHTPFAIAFLDFIELQFINAVKQERTKEVFANNIPSTLAMLLIKQIKSEIKTLYNILYTFITGKHTEHDNDQLNTLLLCFSTNPCQHEIITIIIRHVNSMPPEHVGNVPIIEIPETKSASPEELEGPYSKRHFIMRLLQGPDIDNAGAGGNDKMDMRPCAPPKAALVVGRPVGRSVDGIGTVDGTPV